MPNSITKAQRLPDVQGGDRREAGAQHGAKRTPEQPEQKLTLAATAHSPKASTHRVGDSQTD